MAPPLTSLDGTARFPAYSAHYEDYSPAVDHLSQMRIAMHEMLMSSDPASGARRGAAIQRTVHGQVSGQG